MSELANKAAQEAYVSSLYRMTQEQLIAEVMRVQEAAARLIKDELEEECRQCVEMVWNFASEMDTKKHGALTSIDLMGRLS